MMIFPLIMNGLQYYIIDSFIKEKTTDHEMLASQDDDDNDDYERRGSSSGGIRRDSEDEETPVKINGRSRNNLGGEYDPEVDGDAPTIIGSSSNQPSSKSNSVSVELYPKE